MYYRGTLVNPQADLILSEMSNYIEAGRERLRVSGSYLDFLPSCPTVVDANSYNCTFNSLDAAAFTCTAPSEDAHASCSSDTTFPPNLALILIAVFGGLLIVLMPCSLMLCCCVVRLRKTKLKYHQVSVRYGPENTTVGYLGQQGSPSQLGSESVVETQEITHPKRQVTLDSAIGEMSRASSGSGGDNSVFHGD